MLLKIDMARGRSTVPLGSRKCKVGDTVVTIGSQPGLGTSVTAGLDVIKDSIVADVVLPGSEAVKVLEVDDIIRGWTIC